MWRLKHIRSSESARESFGPADWQKDTTPARLEQSWKRGYFSFKKY
jgi:hypothetical protein